MKTVPAAAFALAVLAATPSSAAEVGRIRAHLFYENSGRLSADIAPPADFDAFNVIIGEGSAEEPANDLLVAVELRGAPTAAAAPLRIVVRDGRGRVLAQRSIAGPFLSAEQPRVWKAVYLQDVGCAGTLRITATLGRSTRTSSVDLVCGE